MEKIIKWTGITKDEALFGWMVCLSVLVVGLVIQNTILQNQIRELQLEMLKLSVR